MYTYLLRYWIPCSIRPDFPQFQVFMNKFCYRLQVGQIRELRSYAFVSCSILFFHLLIFFIICRKIPAVSVIRIRNGSCTNATIWNVWNLWSNFTKLDLWRSRSYSHPFWVYNKLTIAIPSFVTNYIFWRLIQNGQMSVKTFCLCFYTVLFWLPRNVRTNLIWVFTVNTQLNIRLPLILRRYCVQQW